MSRQQTRQLNATDGRAKREGGITEGCGIYETSAEAWGGGVQYVPPGSASTTTQIQIRNTNTHTVAHRPNCAIPEL